MTTEELQRHYERTRDRRCRQVPLKLRKLYLRVLEDRASPRQADVMIVSGRVSRKMAPVLRRIYDQMPEPKWVIPMGACATSGGVFDNYAIVQGVDKIVPVDVYIPRCPPRPEMLIHAIMMLQEKVMRESLRDRSDVPAAEAYEAHPHAAYVPLCSEASDPVCHQLGKRFVLRAV